MHSKFRLAFLSDSGFKNGNVGKSGSPSLWGGGRDASHGCVHAQPGQTQGTGTSPSVQG